jgi:hypothetical protein
MALTEAFIDAHIAKWEAALRVPSYSYREKWPSRLFHHAPIENAVQIITDGHLRSRSDPANQREKDVAAAGVIDHREHAHNFARLYFRPKTPTQWHIEGIRKAGECKFGDKAHAPVLIMLVFDAKRVLSISSVSFCDRNMQLGSAQPGDTEEYFSAIPFQKVFHEGGTGGDSTIKDHRCAEVLVPSPLSLAGNLQWVYCRSSAERDTLIHLLGKLGPAWAKRILVSSDLLVFHREYAFVDEVSLADSGVVFQLNPRVDRKMLDVSVQVWDARGARIINFRNRDMAATPNPPVKRWRVSHPLLDGKYHIQIELDGHLAFKATMYRGSPVF